MEEDTVKKEADDGNILAKLASEENEDKPGPEIPMPTVSDIVQFFRDDPNARADLKAGIKKELKLTGWSGRILDNYFDSYFGKTEAIIKKSKYTSLDEHLELENYWDLAKMAYDHRNAGHTLNWIAQNMDINPKKVQELILAFGERESKKSERENEKRKTPVNKVLKFLKLIS